MQERLQKIISGAGLASRRAAEKMIEEGRVSVNGVVAEIGQLADPETDIITVDGHRIPRKQPCTYVMLNKPKGRVTTMKDEADRPTVAELVQIKGKRLYPVGRLDMYSEGLLIMTDDGELTHKLIHPSHEIEKEYLVWVLGDVKKGLPILTSPMTLDGELLAPAKVRRGQTSGSVTQLSVVIHQGKNRQVRRMCAQAGLEVMRLKRIREGRVALDRTLAPGKWRKLTGEEVALLKNEA